MHVFVCVCVGGGGGGRGEINKWAIYMDVLSLHDEIRTALLYGERAWAMYNSRCVNMIYQLCMGPRVLVQFSSLFTYSCDKCV